MENYLLLVVFVVLWSVATAELCSQSKKDYFNCPGYSHINMLSGNLEGLTIRHAGITTIADITMFTKMTFLDLSYNAIGDITKIRQMISTEKILKTLILRNNRISELTGSQTFNHFGSLQLLDISSNGLSTVGSTVFSALGQLKSLNLSNNSIKSLSPAAFTGLSTLESLDLDYNVIGQLSPETFAPLKRVRELTIQFNLITELVDDTFGAMSELELLHLTSNGIKTVGKHAFRGLYNLKELRLDRNEIRQIPTFSAVILNSLNSLNLDRNPIEMIPTGAFEGLPNLDQLSLVHCKKLKYIGMNGFSGLFQLKKLYLSDNPSLETIDQFAFENGSSLQYLYLHNDNLTGLSEKLIQWDRVEVTLHNNNWNCDCSFSFIGERMLHQFKRTGKGGATVCASPSELAGVELRDVEKTKCSPTVSSMKILVVRVTIALGALIFLTIVLIMIILLRKRLLYSCCPDFCLPTKMEPKYNSSQASAGYNEQGQLIIDYRPGTTFYRGLVPAVQYSGTTKSHKSVQDVPQGLHFNIYYPPDARFQLDEAGYTAPLESVYEEPVSITHGHYPDEQVPFLIHYASSESGSYSSPQPPISPYSGSNIRSSYKMLAKYPVPITEL